MSSPNRLYTWFYIGGWVQFSCLILLFTYLSLTPSPGPLFYSFWDKALHFVGWFTLATSLALAWQKSAYFWLLAIALWLYSCLLEVLQELTGRHLSVHDMLANALGVAAAVLIAIPLRPRLCALINTVLRRPTKNL